LIIKYKIHFLHGKRRSRQDILIAFYSAGACIEFKKEGAFTQHGKYYFDCDIRFMKITRSQMQDPASDLDEIFSTTILSLSAIAQVPNLRAITIDPNSAAGILLTTSA
jgi:hypothetical protein